MGNRLVAFALVAEEYERSGDPIKGLKPLFAPLLLGKTGEDFDATCFAADFSSSYGLQMTPFVAQALAERLAEIGLLNRSYDPQCGEKYQVAEFEWDGSAIQEHQIEETVGLFTSWAKGQVAPAGFEASDAVLEDAILSRLSRPEFASVFAGAAEDKEVRLRSVLGLAPDKPNAKDDAYLDFLVAQFVLQAAIKAPEVFGAISQISYGSLIADAVAGLALPKINRSKKANDLLVMLDGPLVLDLLDLNAPEHTLYAEGLLEIIKSAGIRFGVFEHSLEEMQNTINATLAADDHKEGFGPMAHRFRTEQGQRAHAALVRDSLKSRVEALGVVVVDASRVRGQHYEKFFTEDRLDEVRNDIGDLHQHVDARVRDAESVAAVARMKGVKAAAESIFEAGVIFITRNSVLCKRVLRTLGRGYAEPMPRFAIATDGQLAGVLWFVQGIEGLVLSRKRLIANCAAAILPRKEVVARIASFLEGVRPELREQFEALMADSRASLCTMRLTGGDPEAVDEQKALEIVEEMRQALAMPALERASVAEREAKLAKGEISAVAMQSKEVITVLQENIGMLEHARELDAHNFDLKLAQFQIDLEVRSSEVADSRAREEERRRKLREQILSREQELERKVKRVTRIVEGVLVLMPIAVAFIALDDQMVSTRFAKGLSFLVAIAAIGIIESFLKARLEQIVRLLFNADQTYIDGLRQGLQ